MLSAAGRLVVTDAYKDHKLGLLEEFPVHMHYITDFLKRKEFPLYALCLPSIYCTQLDKKTKGEHLITFFDRSLALKRMF